MLLEVPIVVAMQPMRIAQLTGIRVFDEDPIIKRTEHLFDQLVEIWLELTREKEGAAAP